MSRSHGSGRPGRQGRPGSVVALIALIAWLAAAPAAPAVAEGDARAQAEASAEVGLEWNYAALVAGVKGWLEAFRGGQEAALARAAALRNVDPVVMVGSLLTSHASGSLAEPAQPGDALAAAEALALRWKDRPAARALPSIVATWKSFGRADFERELRVKQALSDVHDLLSAGKDPLARLEAARPDVEASPTSYRAGFLRVEHVVALRRLGRNTEALARAAEVVEHGQRLPWPYLESRGHVLAAGDARILGDLESVTRHLDLARGVHERLGESEAALLIEGKRAIVLRESARHAEALAGMERVRSAAVRAGRRSLARSAAISHASILAEMGRVPEALAQCEAVAREALAERDPVEAARAYALVGQIQGTRDRLSEALVAYERALELAEPTGVLDVPAAALNGLGIVWRKLRRPERAAEAYGRAVRLAERLGDAHTRAAALGNLGLVEAALGRPSARETVARALEAKRRLGDRMGALETVLSVGSMLIERPETRTEGRLRLEEAASVLRQLRSPLRLAACLLSLADAASKDGNGAHALALGEEALALLEQVGDESVHLARARELIGTTHLLAGRPREALAQAREALRIRRRILVGLGDAEASQFLETARAPSDLGLEAALALAQGGNVEEASREAFDILEAGRANLLAAGLVNGPALLAASVPEALLAGEAAARARVVAARSRLLQLASDAKAEPGALLAARATLESTSEAHAEAVSRVQRSAQRAAGVVWPDPRTAADLCPALDRRTAFVAYQFGPQKAAALVATCDGVRLVALGDSASLGIQAASAARLFATPASDEAALAAALYERLVRPLEVHLAERTRLLISPDGALAFLPFEALLRVDGARRERLLERYEVCYAPSATAHLALLAESRGRTPGQGFVGLGDPQPGTGAAQLPALPHSAQEVRDVAALYPAGGRTVLLGPQATLESLVAAFPTSPARLAALHLACHAFIDPQQARLSSLVLAGGEALDIDAIHRLRVPADLVVLSACATGQGTLLRGEGVLGFARGFFVAGVPRVVVSDWVVADDDAARLLTNFHQRLTRDARGPAAALREAKLRALRSPGAHPFHWAAFVLWGLPD